MEFLASFFDEYGLLLAQGTWDTIVMTVVAAGTAGGLVLGFIGAEAAAHLLAAETGVAMSPAMGSPELLAAAATLLAGSFCALIPAWLAGRRPIR